MFTLTAVPGTAGINLVDEPIHGDGVVLVSTLEVGVCGTDREIQRGEYGTAADSDDHLVIGHEAVGVVVTGGGGFVEGDVVTPTVRRGCRDCPPCNGGYADCCLTGNFTEHGMLGLHGFAAEQFRVHPHELVKLPPVLQDVGVLMEPMSVCQRAIRHLKHVSARQPHRTRTALVLGAGTIGLLTAALLRQQGVEVCVGSRESRDSVNAQRCRELGCDYSELQVDDEVATLGGPFDIVVDSTGSAEVALCAVAAVGRNGVLVLLGLDGHRRTLRTDSDQFGAAIVEENKSIIGSANAAPQDWHRAATDLLGISRLRPGWLNGLITARLPLQDYANAFDHPGIKTVISFQPMCRRVS